MRKLTIYLSILIVFLSVSLGTTAEKKEQKPPIDITSDSLEATGEDIIFIGNAKAIYGDMTINAERIQLFYESKTENEKKTKEIKTIVAIGNVFLIEQNRKAWADKMVYERESGIATLTGNPRIKKENNTISGDLIKIYLDEDKVEIKGNVKAVVNPETLKE